MNRDNRNVHGESYQAMRERHQREVNAFPMKWAFTDAQFEKGMRELGLEPWQTDEVIGIGGGGFIRKSDKQAFTGLFARQRRELEAAIAEDTGGFAYDMFMRELGNHEYVITGDLSDTLDACGLSAEQINNDPKLRKALARAIKDYMEAADQ